MCKVFKCPADKCKKLLIMIVGGGGGKTMTSCKFEFNPFSLILWDMTGTVSMVYSNTIFKKLKLVLLLIFFF